MTKQTKRIPPFENEADERKLRESPDCCDLGDWNHAKSVALPNLKPTTKTIPIRLPQHLLDLIKVAANSHDVP